MTKAQETATQALALGCTFLGHWYSCTKGVLFAENRVNHQGSRFVILLPLGNSHLPKEDLIIEENILPAPSHKFHHTSHMASAFQKSSLMTPSTNSKVLIVEDEEDIRNYLAFELSSIYKVMESTNGQEALDIITKGQPDLIISDIMMPVMDGITLCKKIKGNILTSHIPVILLTALSKDEDKAEGIETGADMYLVKPFNSEFLKIAIANLIDNRRKIFEQIQNKPDALVFDHHKHKSHDEILMQKVMTIIKQNISDSNLNVEMLADGVGISRVHMHRKLKEITNQSARDFIKNIRMKQAAYLLTSKKLNVSEVGYAIGYTNLSHFSNTFKSYFGVSPKEYVLRQFSENT